jgi:hypothetical protein
MLLQLALLIISAVQTRRLGRSYAEGGAAAASAALPVAEPVTKPGK